MTLQKKQEGWNDCNHYVTDQIGICTRCGYNTKGITMKQYKAFTNSKLPEAKIL